MKKKMPDINPTHITILLLVLLQIAMTANIYRLNKRVSVLEGAMTGYLQMMMQNE